MKAFFVSIPHSGERVPDEVTWLQGLPEPLLMCDVDRYVDRLYANAIERVNSPSVKAQWHRYVVDLNRLPDDIDVDAVTGATNPSGSFPQGLHWIRTTQMQTLLSKPMSMDFHNQLVTRYFEPFHQEVRKTYDTFRRQGARKIYHLDVHSMPSMGTKAHKDPGQRRAEIVISDCQGKACEKSYLDMVIEAYKTAGFQVAVNWPYVGGRVTQTYGRPDLGQHALQIELNRALYMNEENKQLKSNEAKEIAGRIDKALAAVVEGLPDMGSE